jgi:NAD+ dependent glucose-6-phosphate dehydrogenase
MREVLITGAAGRVGQQLLPGLRERFDLRLMDRIPVPDPDGSATVLLGELTDRRVLNDAVAGVEAIVHLAGNPDPEASWQDLRDPNVEGFAGLLAVCRDRGVRRVIFASSVHAMGFYDGRRRWPIDPGWPPAPCCSYGATKAFDEALARAYDYQTDMSLIGLRLGLSTPEASPAEAVAGWLRPADLHRVVLGALETDVKFGVYHAVSWPGRRRWRIDATIDELGYQPEHDDVPELADAAPATCSGRGQAPA